MEFRARMSERVCVDWVSEEKNRTTYNKISIGFHSPHNL